jgi:dTDP-4-amino-4,6-dideoxygalactose transaminase
LYLIEDACHAIGSEYEGKKIGTFADFTIFSFHPVKHITTGEGGAVTTNDPIFDEKLKILRNHGIDKDLHKRQSKADYAYDMKLLGRNYRLTDIQCALGISQLKKLDYFIDKRNMLTKSYSKILDNNDFIETPTVRPDIKHAWHLYTILLDERLNRDEFFQFMKNNNIGVNVHYIPIYHFSYYKTRFNFKIDDFPVTEEVFKRIITLPLHVGLNQTQIHYICNKIEEFLLNVVKK